MKGFLDMKKKIRQTLGERFRLAIGLDEGAKRFLANSKKLEKVINDVIGALQTKARTEGLNINLKDACIINTLYYRPYHDKKLSVNEYRRASIACICKYLEWCKKELKRGKFERRWLRDFYVDLFQTNILPEMYGRTSCGRTYTNNTFFQYSDIYALLKGKWTPQPVVRDMMALFGLRQVLETKFRRMLGLSWIEPMPKIPHETLPGIISHHETQLKIAKGGRMQMEPIMKIYNWTDYSIHTMTTNFVWLVWMAIDWCSFLFWTSPTHATSYWHINGALEIPQRVLESMREEFRRWLLGNACSKAPDGELRIYWNEPEAPVVDERGHLMKIRSTEEIVSAKSFVREIRRPSICFLIDEWFKETDAEAAFRDNLLKLESMGVKISVLIRNCPAGGSSLIPSLTIKWYAIKSVESADKRDVKKVLKENLVTAIAVPGERDATFVRKLQWFCESQLGKESVVNAFNWTQLMDRDGLKKLHEKLMMIANSDPRLKRKLSV